jgi:hypothetical protein
MTKKRTSQLLAELKTLAAIAVKNLYQRIGLAAEVMGDLDWIAMIHGGSDLKAADALQDEYFRDLGGYVSLGKLILMYQKVDQTQWEEARYDVAAVEVIYDGLTRETHEKGERTSWKKVAEERGERLEDVERSVKQIEEVAEVRKTEVERLREEVERLKAENANLRGRIEELQNLIHAKAA